MADTKRFDEERMTRDEAAAYIGVTAGTMRTWAWSGRHKIPYYRHAWRVYYRRSDLDRWLESQRREHAGC